ncbi:MAG: glycosyltransferase family 2 protein [Sphingobacteriales bacterium]|nr:MAG: glycosyltransferase family 2 protein [Sphingobacteriales bacterium]
MSYPSNPLVSIITLNWNQTPVTCAFLESTRSFSHKNYEILVCDMASDIDPTEVIESGNYPNTRVLRSETNLGFTGGNNWGMRQAKGDFVFIVNNDTEVTPDLLDVLLEPFYSDPLIGVTCPKIKYYDQKEIIQYAGFNRINVYTGRGTAVGSMEEDKGQHDVSGYTHGAHGCAMMLSRKVIEQVGMFPEKFFIYYEEWDWSSRILKAGFKIYYQAKGLIYHKESISMGKESAIKVYYHTRNRILYMRRNTSKAQLLAFYAFFTVFTVPKSIIKFALRRQFKHLNSFIKGTTWNFTTSKQSPV